MPPEIVALIDKPWLLALVLAVGAACGIMVERIGENLNKAKRRAYWERRNGRARARDGNVLPFGKSEPDRTDTAADQLRTVMRASFKSRPLLNKPERRLLTVLDKALEQESPGWRAMGQVSLGEILWSDDKDAFWAINAKRVDLLIIDRDCQPLHAIEFQGGGHHTSEETAARDAVKKEALRRAGIGYVEVVTGDTPTEVREMIRKLVERAGASRSQSV
jgi:hypothetical protein